MRAVERSVARAGYGASCCRVWAAWTWLWGWKRGSRRARYGARNSDDEDGAEGWERHEGGVAFVVEPQVGPRYAEARL